MSKTVDERVVSMQFDNKHFEQNVKTSMSTLDKLKKSLNFKDTGKSLENLNSSIKNVNMSGLGNAVDTVRTKFSALEIMGVTALANITNSAVNAGKRIVSALTIDPIRTGFQEYETQINAVQTILANTKSKGSTIDDVNRALDELNKYADLTIYNFTEMTRNIGTFTAAGVDLETSVSAIQGIANLAAVSGSTSQQASAAMYQLSQALASGTVKLMDWNSVVNAGMGGEVFQNALKKTSELLGTGAEAAIKAEGSFRESLRTGWLTSEVLTETLKKFTTSGANEYVAEYTGLSKEAVEAALEDAKAKYGEAEAIEYASKALAEKSGKNQQEIKDALDMAATATDAATKVKTFTQLWNVLKEAAQSGWSQTWRLIVGDFEEAKSLLTPLADFFTSVIGKISDARNTLLEGALGKTFTNLSDKILGIIKPIEKATDTISETIETVTDLGDIVDKVILGKFGNGKERFDALTESGINYYKVQNKVNEKLGNSYRYTEEQILAQDKLLGVKEESVDKIKEEVKSTVELTEEKKNLIKELASMTEEQMRSKGYTDDQIEAFKELGDTAKKLGIPLNEFIDNMDQIDGRWILINSFKNIGKGLISVFTAIGKAYREIFPPMSSDQLFNIIAGWHKLTTKFIVSEESADKLRRTFKGVFALLDIITTLVGGGFKIAFKVVSAVLSHFNLSILDVTAAIGDGIVGFRDWIKEHDIFTAAIEVIIPLLNKAAKGIKDWFDGIKEADNIPKYIIEGLVNGLTSGVKYVCEAIANLAISLINEAKSILGIHSPSTVFFEVGKNIIEGLVNGIKTGFSNVINIMKELGTNIKKAFSKDGVLSDTKDNVVGFFKGIFKGIADFLGTIDLGAILAAALGFGMLITVKKIADVLGNLTSPLATIGDAISGIGTAIEKNIKAKNFKLKTDAILNLAKALLLLSVSVTLLASVETTDLIKAGIAIGVLTVFMAALIGLTALLKNSKFESVKMGITLLGIANSLLLMSLVFKILSTMNPDSIIPIIYGMTVAISALVVIMLVIGQLANSGTEKEIKAASKALSRIAIALLLMAAVIKVASMLDEDTVKKGMTVVTLFGVLITGFIAVSKLSGEYGSKAGSMLLKISFAMLIMVGVVKAAASLKYGEIERGIVLITGVGLIFAALIGISLLAGKNANKAGSMLLMMSGAFLVMTKVIKTLAEMKQEDIDKGLGIIKSLGLIFGALIAVSLLTGKNAAKAGAMLLEMSIALLIVTGILFIISKMDPNGLGRALSIIAALEILFGGLIAVSHLAGDAKGTLIMLTVAIGILVAAIIGLSFLDQDKLKTATASLSMVMIAFSLLVASTKFAKNTKPMIKTLTSLLIVTALLGAIVWGLSKVDGVKAIPSCLAVSILLESLAASFAILGKAGKISTTVSKQIMTMLFVVGALAAIVAALSLIDGQKAIVSVTALSILLESFSASLLILGKSSRILPTVSSQILPMLAIVTGLAAILGAMSYLNVEASIPTAIALGILLNSMSTALVILSKAGPLASKGVGAMALLGLVVGELAVILGLMSYFDVEPSIETAASLSLLLTAMSGSLVLLGIVGALGPAAFIGIGALATLIAGIGGLVVGIGALVTAIPELETFLDRGIPVIQDIGHAIGSFFGEIVGGVLGGISSAIPDYGTALSEFMTNLQPFIDTVQGIDPSSMEGGKALASMILALTAADIINGLTSWLTGGADLCAFAEDLPAFGQAMVDFSQTVDGKINAEAITNAAKAGEALGDMADSVPKTGGWAQQILGETDMDKFGAGIVAFGSSLILFSSTVDGNINKDAIQAAAEAGGYLTDMADSVPKTGGWAQQILGETDMDKFGAGIVAFGTALSDFNQSVSGIEDTTKIEAAANSGIALAKFADTIPKSGGLFKVFGGENDMENFASQLFQFGIGIKDFYNKLNEGDGINPEVISKCVSALNGLNDLVDGDVANIFSTLGNNDFVNFENFKNNMVTLAQSIVSFSTEASAGIDVGSILTAKTAAGYMFEMAKQIPANDGAFSILPGGNGGSITSFGTQMVAFVKSIKEFATEATSINTEDILTTMVGIQSIIDGIKNMSESVSDGIEEGFKDSTTNFADAVKSMITSGLDEMKNKKESFKNAGKVLFGQFISGMGEKKESVEDKAESLANSAVNATRTDTMYSRFKDAGKYLVNGFISGINSKIESAASKAAEMANAAEKAAKNALDINSPSKVFRRIGYSVPEGFAMGIDKMSYMANDSVDSMADSSLISMRNTISKIADCVNADIDAQPTIRPVLDLSDVRSGAGTISSMFDVSPSVGVLANVNGINSMMNRRIQNGSNADIVSAINKLDKRLSDVGNTTYTINGITYDDGSNVSDAVRTLIRAAKVEGRM